MLTLLSGNYKHQPTLYRTGFLAVSCSIRLSPSNSDRLLTTRYSPDAGLASKESM